MNRKVKFVRDDRSQRTGEEFKTDQSLEMRDDRARYYVSKGSAVYADDGAEKPAAESTGSEKSKEPVLTGDEYDRAVASIASGEFTIDYAAPQMARHFGVSEDTVRGELAARVEKLKAEQQSQSQQKAASDTNQTSSSASEKADATTGAVAGESKGATDGNAVAGATDVAGKDSGGASERGEHAAGRGRGGSRGGRAGGSGQSNV